ncbi:MULTISPECIES: hypothetical protein [Prauserella salsuginis group]|uniref:Uncharacterized protein n=2 Tax=Prauserella salsuginis group TaxID=2893672 RepID=A0A839XRB8_9PSEU|nr:MULTISPECIES: hypothetical protein [Prauserella salsuginis group]MBB3666342.1 hypothetical protein [Prauserella sediminis]MCR3718119.1 hypothetical protein [Prauserella flava]MCR3732689.1 hypothetical protein [Prauserella salsuginis]
MLPIIPLAIGVGAVVAGAALPARRRSEHRRELAAATATARAAHNRLGFCLETLAPGDNAAAADSLARARERWHTTGALLAEATTAEECRVADEVAAAGMDHIVRACRLLGTPLPYSGAVDDTGA